LPLALDEAHSHIRHFPLAVMWTSALQGSRALTLTTHLVVTVKLCGRKQIDVHIAPAAYIPPALPCPSLTSEPTSISHGADGGDTSAEAPAVYRYRKVVDREDFDNERGALISQANILPPYAHWLMERAPSLQENSSGGEDANGRERRNFSTLLLRLSQVDVANFARRQFPVMTELTAKTAGVPGLAKFHWCYCKYADKLEHLLEQRPGATG